MFTRFRACRGLPFPNHKNAISGLTVLQGIHKMASVRKVVIESGRALRAWEWGRCHSDPRRDSECAR